MTNFLRLWSSEAIDSFDFQAFNKGDYYDAVREKVASETISKVLYPNDEPEAGKVLRLQQQYFFTCCSLQDMMRIHCCAHGSPHTFHETYAVQLNDTHPSIAVAELMRLLVDIHGIEWEEAGTSPRRRWPTPTTRFCPRLWRNGLCRFSPNCCPGTWRSSTRSIAASSTKCAQSIPETMTCVARVSLIDETNLSTFAWHISPPSAHMP